MTKDNDSIGKRLVDQVILMGCGTVNHGIGGRLSAYLDARADALQSMPALHDDDF